MYTERIRNVFYTPSTLGFWRSNKFPVFLVDSPVLRACKLEIYSSVVKVGAAFVLYIENSVHSRASKITNGALRIPFKFLKAICLSNFVYYPFRYICYLIMTNGLILKYVLEFKNHIIISLILFITSWDFMWKCYCYYSRYCELRKHCNTSQNLYRLLWSTLRRWEVLVAVRSHIDF